MTSDLGVAYVIYVQYVVIDKKIKQWRTRVKLRDCIKAKVGHLNHKL